MALDIPLMNTTDPQQPQIPVPYHYEQYILFRKGVECQLQDQNQKYPNVRGMLFLTNIRMVFVVSEKEIRRSHFRSFEAPLEGVWDESFNQPIFFANNLTGTCQYYDGQGFQGTLGFTFTFKEGGVNTFLRFFTDILGRTRQAMQQRQRMENEASSYGLDPASFPSFTSPPVTSNLAQHQAFVDPNDPSRVFATQPIEQNFSDYAPQRTGLRRRNVG